MAAIKGLRRRLDGFISTVTGIGTARDKKNSVSHVRGIRKTDEQLDDIYAEQALAKRIVNLFPDDGLRKWIEVDHDLNPEILRILKRITAKDCVKSAARKSRLHGGSAVYIDILDGRSMEQPVNPNYAGFKVNALRVIEKSGLEPLVTDPINGTPATSYNPDARSAEYFRMYNSMGDALIVHRDRLLVFSGVEISDHYRHGNSGWGESVLRDCIEPLMAYALTHGVVPTIVQDFIIGILKLHGLNETIEADDDSSLKARLDAAITGEGYVNKLVIDSNDDYSREVANVAGLDNLIRHPERWLAAASGIPHTKLLAESAGGSLGEGGKNQKSDWEEAVEAYQQDALLTPLEKLVMYAGYELRIRDPLDIKFNPLRVMSQAELADIHVKQAQADTAYYNMGLPEEIIFRSRFEGGYSVETQYDPAEYSAELELDRIGDTEAAQSSEAQA